MHQLRGRGRGGRGRRGASMVSAVAVGVTSRPGRGPGGRRRSACTWAAWCSSRAACSSQVTAASRSSVVLPRLAVSARQARAPSSSCGSRNIAEQSASAIRPIVRRLTPSRSMTRCCRQSAPARSARTASSRPGVIASGAVAGCRQRTRVGVHAEVLVSEHRAQIVQPVERPHNFELVADVAGHRGALARSTSP